MHRCKLQCIRLLGLLPEVGHDIMIEILDEIGIDEKYLRIIANLYWNQTAVLKMEGETTDPIEIRRGVENIY
ncbi:Retrovirus-related Pol polyprotein from type-2 retrotransposable element R2DM [Aphis craccivora]|uniref:Retrovirus-related Pol polyprotein from type-2 retrotransposable element R2DM n=1 Tax=Aphis craccivora TaxID=307492 RepID=A0A6G0YER5_APHCR|nr:Retrovirus-related Pol polyprotein from type-2 retrotransposable element R2DM [Aphis craccivora]